MANRVWQHLLGEGLVRTPDNFGAKRRNTQPPRTARLTSPAASRTATDWSMKSPRPRHRLLSRTYQLSSDPAPAHLDRRPREPPARPRAHRRRLDAEAIRDAALVVSRPARPRPSAAPTLGNPGHTLRVSATSSTRARRSVYVPRLPQQPSPTSSTVFDCRRPEPRRRQAPRHQPSPPRRSS